MLSEYVRAAMRNARYQMQDDGKIYGEIPGFNGAEASADTLIGCQHNLAEVLEEWIFFRVSRNLPVPDVDGIHLPIKDTL